MRSCEMKAQSCRNYALLHRLEEIGTGDPSLGA